MNAEKRKYTHVVAACYLGWTLDAFDFFIMVFVFQDVAKTFGLSVTSTTFAVTLTLAMRALGAYAFGRLADRVGRRPALMASILGYSLLGFCTGLAPNAGIFFVIRALFGLAMGGEWGVGASLTMESIPVSWRGPVSGLLQAGYPSGYLLASLLYLAYPILGWRGMFMMGAVPALLVLYIRGRVAESPDWQERAREGPQRSLWETVKRHAGLIVYAALLMACFNFFSHGTQDFYPHYLKVQLHFSVRTVSAIAIVFNLGAMLGGIAFGALSQRSGRRVAIVIATALSLPLLYLWAFTAQPVTIAIGAFLMQFCVQGAWGVIPVHLNELSPANIRGTFPGLVYQLGNFLAAINLPLQSSLTAHSGGNHRWALAGVASASALLIMLLVAFGREAKDVRMGNFGTGDPGEGSPPAHA